MTICFFLICSFAEYNYLDGFDNRHCYRYVLYPFVIFPFVLFNCYPCKYSGFIFLWTTAGAKHLDQCPIQPNIPIYLIVVGVTIILALLLTYTRATLESPFVYLVATACMNVLHLHNFCWLIAGWSLCHYCVCLIWRSISLTLWINFDCKI